MSYALENITIHPHPCPPPSRGRKYGGNKNSQPLVGGVRVCHANYTVGGCELLLKNNAQGFTLIEVVIGLAISLILMGVAVSIFNVQRKSYNLQEHLTEMQQNVRAAMDMMVREVRMAGYDPTGAGFVGIGTNTTTLLQILADLDDNGTTTGTYENITYQYFNASAGTLSCQIRRNTGTETESLAGDIDGCNFLYYDGNGIVTTTASSIRQIQITVTGRTSKPDPSYGYSYGTLTSSVTPINLGY